MKGRPFSVVYLMAGLTIALLLLSCMGLFAPIDFALNLAVGWALFLARVAPLTEVDPGGIATALICLGLLTAGGHAFLGWLQGAIRGPEHRWPFRWTASLVGTVVVMFAAGMATAGVAHQVGWLVSSGDCLVETTNRGAAYRTHSVNNLKQIVLGVHEYHSKYGSHLPNASFDPIGRPMHGWIAKILPFMEEQAVYDQIDFERPWNDEVNRPPYQTRLRANLNPRYIEESQARDKAGYALGHYAGNARLVGLPRTIAGITDGIANTILAGEIAEGFRPWGDPAHWRDPGLGVNRSADGFGGPFVGGANFAFADGSVRFIKNTIDPRVLKALATPDGGEVVSAGSY